MTREKFEHEGFTIVVEPEEFADSPDEWGDNSLFLVAFHRQFSVDREGLRNRHDLEDWEETHHIYPLRAYIHGGVSLSLTNDKPPFNDRWDSCWAGSVLVKKNEEWPEGPRKVAESLVEIWNQHLSGDVWFCSVQDSSGKVLEDCGVIYGHDHAVEWGKEMASSLRNERRDVKVIELYSADDNFWSRHTYRVPVFIGVDDVPKWIMCQSDIKALVKVIVEEG